MKKYIIRSVKYLVAFAVLYVGMLWVMLQWNNPNGQTLWGVISDNFQDGWRGWSMVVGVIVLGATYPFFGYVKRQFPANIITDREQLNRAADFTGLVLVAESDTELVYRAKGLRRLVMLFEDEVRVRQVGENVEVEGLRRVAVRMAFDADRYITNKRRNE